MQNMRNTRINPTPTLVDYIFYERIYSDNPSGSLYGREYGDPTASPISERGPLSLMGLGLVALWRELKAERKRSDERHEKHLSFTAECTDVLREINQKQCSFKNKNH